MLGGQLSSNNQSQPALKQGAKYCKLGGKVRPVIDFGRRQVGGGIFLFGNWLELWQFSLRQVLARSTKMLLTLSKNTKFFSFSY